MKKFSPLILLASVVFCSPAQAQTPFHTFDFVDINNINARVMVHGDMFWNPDSGAASCEFPKGSGKHINFASAIWMSGYDAGGGLHVSAQTYRQTGNDYWPGPLDASDTLTNATSFKWAHIWKVNRTDIQYFQSLSIWDTTTVPANILTWPGKGNTHAKGNAGYLLTITNDMAPFVDLNGNGTYEPLLGEYPDIKGDQALWWVFSDNGPAHNATHGKPLGVEVHTMAYAYKRCTLIDNVIYFDYNIMNRSPRNYTNFRIGLWDDMDLGYSYDDYIGYDSTHRMGITYNGTTDDGGIGGHPANSYGTHIPTAGITLVSLPGDSGPAIVPAGSYTSYNNDFSSYGNPVTDTQYSNYLRSENGLGIHFTNTFGGPGQPCLSQGSGPATNYIYTGDPSDTNSWSECNCKNIPGDRRFIIASNDFALPSESSQHLVMALVTTNPLLSNGCPTAKFDSIKTVADTAWYNYHNPPLPIPPSGIANLNSIKNVLIYPNPAHDKLIIENPGTSIGEETISIYNTIGQLLHLPVSKSGNRMEADISTLPVGLYLIRYHNGEVLQTAKFMKE